MATFLFWFFLIWVFSGLLVLPLKYLNRRIMHDTALGFTQDIVLDKNGEKVIVEGGNKVYLQLIASGLFGLWVMFGALGMALSEYVTDTNYPGKKRFSFWRGDHKQFLKAGPLALLAILPKATVKFFRSLV